MKNILKNTISIISRDNITDLSNLTSSSAAQLTPGAMIENSNFSDILPWSIVLIGIVVICIGTTTYFLTLSEKREDDNSNSIPSNLRDSFSEESNVRPGSPIEFRRSSAPQETAPQEIDFDNFV